MVCGHDSGALVRFGFNVGVSFPKLMFRFRLKSISGFEQMQPIRGHMKLAVNKVWVTQFHFSFTISMNYWMLAKRKKEECCGKFFISEIMSRY